ncbi:unnamed protein product [Symbiodinium sp. KB8]|nr:unnamed protein product [Symbiodinium sp. KB8]
MLPLIVLDGNLTMHERLVNTIVFSTMFLVFKFVTGNIIEVQLYAKSGGDLMRMHPVIMLALMMLFQTLMGMTGMFMTVPVMAAAKYYMLSMNVPSAVLDPLLTCLEGSEQGPHMNFVEQEKCRNDAPSRKNIPLSALGCSSCTDLQKGTTSAYLFDESIETNHFLMPAEKILERAAFGIDITALANAKAAAAGGARPVLQPQPDEDVEPVANEGNLEIYSRRSPVVFKNEKGS